MPSFELENQALDKMEEWDEACLKEVGARWGLDLYEVMAICGRGQDRRWKGSNLTKHFHLGDDPLRFD